MFTYYKIDKDHRTVTVAVNPEMTEILNNLANWTRFSLHQFVMMKSTYAKTAFRLLKQYRTIGKRKFSMEEFRTLFLVPKSYQTSDINKRILKPIKIELSSYFKGFQISKVRRGTGGKITGYTFTWKPESKDSDDFSLGASRDERRRLANIKFNADLTKDEKEQAYEKILNDNPNSKK